MGDKKRHQRHKNKIDKIKYNKRRRVKSVQSTPDEESSTLSDKDRRMLAAVINGVSKASNHNVSINGR